MSGHSKWSTIKRQKGANDAKRGQTFTKLANAIAIAARTGNSGNVDDNPRLRLAVEQARTANMPKDNVQRAIDRGLGRLPGQTLEEVIYEGFGPGKVAFFIEVVTDNRQRTTAEIRNLFDRNGGNMGNQGVTAYMFDKKGEIHLQSQGQSAEDELLELMDSGAEDVEAIDDGGYLATTQPTDLTSVSNKITQMGYPIEASDLTMVPNILVDIADLEVAKKAISLAEKFEDHDDVQKVYANFNFSAEVADSLNS